ncbi:MAG: efflux RND transporter periplasmic adaptor subunit [Acidobacteriales bacterium]|nr:efflux RND transporter periplasmic adaptor subunit [Terriglobales bacterium]
MSLISHSTPSTDENSSKSRLRWLLLPLLLVGAGATGYLIWGKPAPQSKKASVVVVRTVKATTGPMARTLRLTGQTSARVFAAITAPRLRGPERGNAMILIRLVKSGSTVKKGELLAEIDSTSTRDHIDDVQDMVTAAEKDIVKRKAEQAVEWENLQQTLRVAKADVDKARLEVKAAEVRTVVDQELLKLSVEEAEAQYKQLQGDVVNKKIIHDAELKILQVTCRRQQMHLERHTTDLSKLVMHAPMEGLAVMMPIFRNGEFGQVELGDQVGPGQPFIRVVKPDSMQLEATVNQAEATVLRLGLESEITLDAFPGVKYHGKVDSIGALATGGWRQNYFIRNIPIRVHIDNQDSRLIPDLSGAADVTLERKENVVRVPLEAVFMESGKPAVFVREGGRFVRRAVELGLESNTHVEVVSGLKGGEEVAVEKPPARVG